MPDTFIELGPKPNGSNTTPVDPSNQQTVEITTVDEHSNDISNPSLRRRTVVTLAPTPGIAEGLAAATRSVVGLGGGSLSVDASAPVKDPIETLRARNERYGDFIGLARSTVSAHDARLDPSDPSFDIEFLLTTAKLQRQQRYKEKGLRGADTTRGGVSWKNLRVQGIDLGGREIDTVVSSVFACFKPLEAINASPEPPQGPILQSFTGFVGPQEMALVLGKPGSGCSTFLRALAGQHRFFKDVSGDIHIAGVPLADFTKKYKGELMYSGEDDFHYPQLTVRQTLDFALRCRIGESDVPLVDSGLSASELRAQAVDMVLRVLSLTKAADTIVGNAYIRGVSGGERKRTSIAEQILVGSTLGFYDGSTKGLDSASALDFVKALRLSCDYMGRTNFASLYQASEAVYEEFQKVILIDAGRCIYMGPTNEAKAYFEKLGFVCPPRATTPDFLTGVAVPSERILAPGFEGKVPNSPEEFEKAWLSSPECAKMLQEMAVYESTSEQAAKDFAEAFESYRVAADSKVTDTYPTTFGEQLAACMIREGQLLWGDRYEILSRILFDVVMAIIVGGLYFRLPFTGSGAFSRGGVLFFGLLFNALGATAEIPGTVEGRQVLYKHKSFMLYQPMLYYLAKVVWDIPIKMIQVLLYSVILYFMVGLNFLDRGIHFAIFYFVLLVTFLAFTAFSRMIGTYSQDINTANLVSGVIIIIFLVYNGYLIPFSQMMPWFAWITWINVLAYAYKALAVNEFVGQNFYCTGDNLVPPYPDAPIAYQACIIPGSTPGVDFVSGADYLAARFGDMGNIGINFLAIVCFFIGFTVLAIIGTELIEYGKGGISVNVFKRRARREKRAAMDTTMVLGAGQTIVSVESKQGTASAETELAVFKGRPFTWMNLNYYVPVNKGQRRLLENVAGYVVPGRMIALMGSSGAGKSTLLDVLAQRKTIGKIDGEVYLGSSPQGPDFKQITGYAEQTDNHMPTQTVHEALMFSAELRQPPETAREEKRKWVDEVIDLLEMHNIRDAMIGSVESGLGISIEERKRLTIAVELVAKPQILFLDEPTSGLDSTASNSIVRLIKKLAQLGQAVICTIHQPSAMLFENFDDLLMLGRGGRTIYVGPIGEHSRTVLDYFERNGCPKLDSRGNPAEYILDAMNGREGSASPSKKNQDDWIDAWNLSKEKAALEAEVLRLRSESLARPAAEASQTQAVADGSRNPNETSIVIKRMLVNYYRQPSYNVGRALMQFTSGLILGLSFLNVQNTLAGLQNRMFAIFQTSTLGALVVGQVQPSLIDERKWFNREVGSGFYSWRSFFAAMVVAEIPFSFISACLFFIGFYFLVGLPLGSQAAFFFITYILVTFFWVTLGQSIAALSPTLTVATIINPLTTSILNLVAGVAIPVYSMPVVFAYTLYWMTPDHYYLEAVLGSDMQGLVVTCAPSEYVVYNPPPGQTCQQWSAAFLPSAPGYLSNPAATSGCQYCPVATGEAFLGLQLTWTPAHKWRNFGILAAFTVFNVITTGLFIYRRRKGDPR